MKSFTLSAVPPIFDNELITSSITSLATELLVAGRLAAACLMAVMLVMHW